jgi:hypothetical protein
MAANEARGEGVECRVELPVDWLSTDCEAVSDKSTRDQRVARVHMPAVLNCGLFRRVLGGTAQKMDVPPECQQQKSASPNRQER